MRGSSGFTLASGAARDSPVPVALFEFPSTPKMPTPSASARRRPTQARARHTVEAILDAAAELFDAGGFEAVTTDRIVARAGVSIGSMYQYFPNKEALLAALAERHGAEVDALQRAWLDRLAAERPSVDEGLRAWVDWLVTAHVVRPHLRWLLFDERALPRAIRCRMEVAHAHAVDGLAAWLDGVVEHPRVTATLLHRTVPALVHHFVLHPHPEVPPDLAVRHVLALARAYVAATPAR
jgi:AcrR family transcriptional regulator